MRLPLLTCEVSHPPLSVTNADAAALACGDISRSLLLAGHTSRSILVPANRGLSIPGLTKLPEKPGADTVAVSLVPL